MSSRTIFFDFDGTIVDSFALNIEVFYEVSGKPKLTREQLAKVKQQPVSKVLKELNIPLWRIPKIIKRGREKLNERVDELHAFEGMPDVIRKLHERGYQLSIISSNSEQNIRTFLASNNIESYFDGIYGDVGVFGKSTVLKRIIKNNGLSRDDCYYVGDELRDITAARKAGVPAVAVSWGYQDAQALAHQKPFALVDKPADLDKLLQ